MPQQTVSNAQRLTQSPAYLLEALRSQDCSICLEPLSQPIGKPHRYSVVRAHRARNSAENRTGRNSADTSTNRPLPTRQTLATIPEESPSQAHQLDVADVLSQEHLFHTNCYAEHVARNGSRMGPIQQDWHLRCPLCRKSINFSEITPYHDTANQPHWWQAIAFKRQVRETVQALVDTNNLENRRPPSHPSLTPTRGFIASPRQVMNHNVYARSLRSTQSRLNVGMHGRRTPNTTLQDSTPSNLAPRDQQTVGGGCRGYWHNRRADAWAGGCCRHAWHIRRLHVWRWCHASVHSR